MSPATHDHGLCIAQALHQAEQHCRQAGLRLTALRRRVLELVWRSHVPVAAYDLLPILGQEGYCAAPPTIYRALDFLLEQHLIHRIARRNAFVGCTHPGHPHDGAFLLCRQCGKAAEIHDPGLEQAIRLAAEQQGFSLSSLMLEADGVCAQCRNSPLPPLEASGDDHV